MNALEKSIYEKLVAELDRFGVVNPNEDGSDKVRVVLPKRGKDGSYAYANPYVKVMWNLSGKKQSSVQQVTPTPAPQKKVYTKKQLAKHPELAEKKQEVAPVIETVTPEKFRYFVRLYVSSLPTKISNYFCDLQTEGEGDIHVFTKEGEKEVAK